MMQFGLALFYVSDRCRNETSLVNVNAIELQYMIETHRAKVYRRETVALERLIPTQFHVGLR